MMVFMMVLMMVIVLMMVPMMLGAIAMMMAAIPPLQEGNSPVDFSLLELFFSLSGFRLVEAAEKLFVDTPDVFSSMGGNTPKGSRRGATGARAGLTRGLGWSRGRWRPCLLELHSMPPFGFVTYSS